MKDSTRRGFLKTGLIGSVMAGASAAQASEKRKPTPTEVEGPFYPVVAQKDKDFDLTKVEGQENVAQGDVLIVHGRVLDEEGQPIQDASVDLWQANTFGRYRHPADDSDAKLDPGFQGWAIVPSGKDGAFRFKTIKPGAYKVGRNWTRPPHIHFKIGKRGYVELTTQMYFPDEALNDVDRLLKRHEEADQALMISRAVEGADIPTFEFDIVLRKA